MRHLDEAERQYQEAQAIAERLDEAPLLGAVLFNRSWLAGDRDELAAALALCVAAQRQFERSGNLRGLRACAAQRYKIALAEGHFAEALPPLRERLLWLQQNGEPYVEELTDLGYVLLGQGHLAEAHATLERALTLAQAWPRPDGLLMPLLGCQTLVLLREGALDAARSPLIQLLQLQRSCDGDVKLWYFLTIAACLGWAQGHLEDTHQAALRRALGVEEELRSALSALSTQELLAEKLRGRLCDPHTLLETLLEALTSH
jgi:Flp pilus assembly protein TadD